MDSEHPVANIRHEPTAVQSFNNKVLNTAGNVEPYSLERPLDSSLARSSAAATNPVAEPHGSSYVAAPQSPEPSAAPASSDSGHPISTARDESSGSSGGFFDRIKDKVSELVHGHEDQDKDSAFPTTRTEAPDLDVHKGDIRDRDARVEPSDSSNTSTGGSWIHRGDSHRDEGSLPFALDKDVAQHEPREASGSTLGSLVAGLVAPTSSTISGSAAVSDVPHPAAENTSDFSFWQPPADAPVEKGGFNVLEHPDSESASALKDNVSETTRHATTWEGK